MKSIFLPLVALLGTLFGCPDAHASTNPVVAVVYGELSVPAEERTYSRALGRNLTRWLDDAGLVSASFPDSRAKEALARPRSVAHLINVAEPSPALLAEIDVFLARGGKLVVYNTLSEKLAERLGVAVAGYRSAATFGQWTQFRFVDKALLNAPAVVHEAPAALREVAPAGPGTRVVAWWEDREGRRTPYAAWLQHANGFWMTHVLLGDTDGEARGRLLTAITGACAASTWRVASDTLYARLGPLVGAADCSAAIQSLASRCPASRRPALEPLLGELGTLHAAIIGLRKQGLHAAATAKLWELRRMLVEAYATIQTPWRGSVRAMWDHEGFGLFLGDWEATCEALSRSGVTDLFLLVATPTTTHAQVPGLAPSRLRRDHGDQLAAAIPAARRHGLRVHAWVVAMSADAATRPELDALGAAGRLLGDRDGQRRSWLDPRHPANRERLRQTVRHLATNYDVDGIHLDYIRYPDFQAGLDAKGRAAFERSSGRPVAAWPDDVSYPARSRFAEYVAYRAAGLSTLVADVRRDVRAAKPKARLSTAVFGRYPLCVDSVGQDWIAWLRAGSIDWAVPMNYSEDLAKYRGFLDEQGVSAELRRKIITGLGVTAAESTLNAVQVIDQIDAARDRGFGGYALFDLDATVRLDVLPFLRLGINGR